MDPFAHTLFGAALAETGLRRASRYATAALLIGANLPDVDGIAHLAGGDATLYWRRGWSHGVLAMLLLPLLLTATLLAWHRLFGRRRNDAPPPRPWPLLALACIGVWSHPLLDWMNTYGVRLLMPLDGQWFHGDTLYIVDPWVWLMLAAGVIVARSSAWYSALGWGLLAVLATRLVLRQDLPAAVGIVWCSGLALILLLRWRLGSDGGVVVARIGVVAAALYATAMFGLARQAEARALQQHPDAILAQASPMPGQPRVHRVVVVEPQRYLILDGDGRVTELERTPMDAQVQRAFADPSIRGFATWTRFPWWQTEPLADGRVRVRFFDLRYARPGRGGGIGVAEVIVDDG